VFPRILSVGDRLSGGEGTWADLQFGLERARRDLSKTLSQAFQVGIFMVPGWTICNLGMNKPYMTTTDFSPVYELVEFFTAYFSDPKFGNPSFEAID